MGGVDLLEIFDRSVTQYRPTIQKWYWPLFLNFVEPITVVVWRLHVMAKCCATQDLLGFA